MSRRRQFTEPVAHAYWPHSDPGPPADYESADTPSRYPAEDPCPGQCNRAFRAAEEAREDHDVVMHPGRPVWCVDVPRVNDRGEVLDGPPAHHGCTERITADLAAIPDLATHLTPGPLNTPRDVTGRHGSNPAQPSVSPGWDAADEVIRWAVELEDQLRVRLGHQSRREHWRDLGSAVRYLAAYATALLSGPDAEVIGRQIMGRRRQLEQNTGTDRLVHRLPGSCMVCDRKGLQRKDGGDLVKCRHCGATWAWEHYELLSRAYADDVRRRGA